MMPETKNSVSGVAKFFSAHGAGARFASSGAQFRWHMRRWVTALGKPGIFAIGLLVICASWYLTSLLPMQQRFDEAQRALSRQQQNSNSAARIAGSKGTPTEQLQEFYRFFPNEHQSPELLEKLFSIAQQNGLELNDGEYKVSRDKTGLLMRLGVSLPVRGKYPQIRKFLSSLNKEIPNLALEKVQFERKNIVDSTVQAKIALALYLVQEP